MALRSLDNALPAALERPKKLPKLSPAVAGENSAAPPPPLRVREQSTEYMASEDLKPLPDPEARIKCLLGDLDSKDWTKACKALYDLRCFAVHHRSLLLPILENALLVMVKAMKSPRSALCKTSIMASTDIFHSFGHILLAESMETAAFDQLLLQLLLKASQDKRFVCEEAEKALESMANFISSLPLLEKLQVYVNHGNLRVRAKAAVAISKCASNMRIESMKEFGLAKLLQVAAELLNDRLPEAREAARNIINSIYCNGFSRDTETKQEDESATTKDTWQDFCSSNLPPISAQSIVKFILQQQ